MTKARLAKNPKAPEGEGVGIGSPDGSGVGVGICAVSFLGGVTTGSLIICSVLRSSRTSPLFSYRYSGIELFICPKPQTKSVSLRVKLASTLLLDVDKLSLVLKGRENLTEKFAEEKSGEKFALIVEMSVMF